MRLIEEKFLMKLNIISTLVVFVTTIITQFADYQIFKDDVDKRNRILSALQIHQNHLDYRLAAEFYTIYKAEGYQVTPRDTIPSIYGDPEMIELRRKLKAEEISMTEYYDQFIEYHKDRSKALIFKSNLITESVMKQKSSCWIWIKRFILIPIQLIGIVILLFGYYRLFVLISERTTNK